jgi:DNA polymerase III delta subunit
VDYREFFKKIKSEDPSPLYFFKGDETYIMEKAIDALLNKISPARKRIFYADEMEADEILRNTSKMDLFGAQNTLTVVKKCEVLKGISKFIERGKWDKGNILVLVSISPPKNLISQLPSNISIVNFTFPTSEEYSTWLKREIKRRNIRMDTKSIKTLKNKFPKSLNFISRELDKLALFSDGEPVDDVILDEILVEEEEITHWRIIDLVVKGNKKMLFTQLEKYIKQGRPVEDIFYGMAQTIFYTLLAKTNPELLKKTVKEEWKRDKYRKFAQFYEEEELFRTMGLLQKIFLRSRTIQLNRSLIIKNFFLSIL